MLLYVYGDVDVHSVFVAALPTSHPNVAPERHLEISAAWKARPIPYGPTSLFIGVISAGDHFAERMAVRKSWMQDHLIRSSAVVARFFVALVNSEDCNFCKSTFQLYSFAEELTCVLFSPASLCSMERQESTRS